MFGGYHMANKDDYIQRYNEIKQEAEKVYQEKILPEISEPVKKFCQKLSDDVNKDFKALCRRALCTGVVMPLQDFGIPFHIVRRDGEFSIASKITNSFILPINMEDIYFLTIEALERAIKEDLAQYKIVLEKKSESTSDCYDSTNCPSYFYICYLSDK